MSVEVVTQIVTLALAVLAIIWHQQRTIDKLREEVFTAIDKLREEVFTAIGSLRDAVVENGQRIARIEGFLRIGIPADVAAPETSPKKPTATQPTADKPAIEPATGG